MREDGMGSNGIRNTGTWKEVAQSKQRALYGTLEHFITEARNMVNNFSICADVSDEARETRCHFPIQFST